MKATGGFCYCNIWLVKKLQRRESWRIEFMLNPMFHPVATCLFADMETSGTDHDRSQDPMLTTPGEWERPCEQETVETIAGAAKKPPSTDAATV